jgi:hypothetical protein
VRKAPNRFQVTPPLLGSLLTVAVNCCVPPEGTAAELGAMETVIAGIVIVAEADTAGFVTEAAVSVTVKLLAGAAAGAV